MVPLERHRRRGVAVATRHRSRHWSAATASSRSSCRPSASSPFAAIKPKGLGGRPTLSTRWLPPPPVLPHGRSSDARTSRLEGTAHGHIIPFVDSTDFRIPLLGRGVGRDDLCNMNCWMVEHACVLFEEVGRTWAHGRRAWRGHAGVRGWRTRMA